MCYPTEAQWLAFAARFLKLSPADLCARIDLYALTAGLEAPQAIPRQPGDEIETYLAQLSVLLTGFLTRPPFGPRRRALAFETTDLTCALNGFKLLASKRDRTNLALEIDRPALDPAEIKAWLRRAVRPLSPAELQPARSRAQEQMTSSPAPERPLMFVSVPWTRIPTESDDDAPSERERLKSLAHDIRIAVSNAVPRLLVSNGEPLPPSDLWPSDALGVIRIEAPAPDFDWNGSETRQNCMWAREMLWQASAIIILGLRGGSHGTGVESCMVGRGIPTLYVHWSDRFGAPPAVLGNLAGNNVTVEPVRHDYEVLPVVERWTHQHWRAIQRAWRRTEVRQLLFGPLAEGFGRALQDLTEAERKTAAVLAGVDPELYPALMTPHGLAWLGPQLYGEAAAVLGVSPAEFLPSSSRMTLTTRQIDALLEMTIEYGVRADEAKGLRREAESQQLLGVLRFALTSVGDWVDFRKQLRGERSGLT